MALTLEDIAEMSGLSRSTVSRVINGDLYVSERTRQAVLHLLRAGRQNPHRYDQNRLDLTTSNGLIG